MPTKKLFSALLCCGVLSASLDVTRTGVSYNLIAPSSSGQLLVASGEALTDGNEPYGVVAQILLSQKQRVAQHSHYHP